MMFIPIFILILFGRANSYLFGFEVLNEDESQMMANAIKIYLENYNVFALDGTSSGFFNSLILTWPTFIGLDITFLTTRLTAITIISLIFYIIYLYFRIEVSRSKSIFLILPAVLFFSLTKDPDFLHYSSELLSTLLLVFSVYGFKIYLHTNKIKIHLISITLLSFVIFSKTQIIPTSLTIFSLICFYYIWKKNYFDFIKVSIFFTSPIILIIISYYFPFIHYLFHFQI